jgi:hypothetical protein
MAFCLMAIRVFPQSPVQNDDSRYCAKLKDGIMVVTLNDQVITSDIVLRDSSRITKDAVLIKKNGKRMVLKEEECIDIDGNILAARFDQKSPGDKRKKGTQ